MPRIARVVGVGYPHHITQRGNYRQDIFEDDTDRDKYLNVLHTESKRYKLDILVYCLMTNHVHFIAVPERKDAMGKVFKYVNMKYSQYFNEKKGERGHFFQGRFFSSIMDENYTLKCARYIERNPARAKIVKRAWDWKWSSARVHCGMEENEQLAESMLFKYIGIGQNEWKEFISQEDDPKEVKRIKEETIKGRVIADIDFIRELGKKLKMTLEIKPKGRPKKKGKKGNLK